LGIIYLLDTGAVSIKERNKLVGRWVTYEELKSSIYHKLESWSRYALDFIYEDEYFHKNLGF
jgi:predicted NUDIX family phosphoesterase